MVFGRDAMHTAKFRLASRRALVFREKIFNCLKHIYSISSLEGKGGIKIGRKEKDEERLRVLGIKNITEEVAG